jgi:hypothetical protein
MKIPLNINSVIVLQNTKTNKIIFIHLGRDEEGNFYFDKKIEDNMMKNIILSTSKKLLEKNTPSYTRVLWKYRKLSLRGFFNKKKEGEDILMFLNETFMLPEWKDLGYINKNHKLLLYINRDGIVYDKLDALIKQNTDIEEIVVELNDLLIVNNPNNKSMVVHLIMPFIDGKNEIVLRKQKLFLYDIENKTDKEIYQNFMDNSICVESRKWIQFFTVLNGTHVKKPITKYIIEFKDNDGVVNRAGSLTNRFNVYRHILKNAII